MPDLDFDVAEGVQSPFEGRDGVVVVAAAVGAVAIVVTRFVVSSSFSADDDCGDCDHCGDEKLGVIE